MEKLFLEELEKELKRLELLATIVEKPDDFLQGRIEELEQVIDLARYCFMK